MLYVKIENEIIYYRGSIIEDYKKYKVDSLGEPGTMGVNLGLYSKLISYRLV